jgi:hypothetical protein
MYHAFCLMRLGVGPVVASVQVSANAFVRGGATEFLRFSRECTCTRCSTTTGRHFFGAAHAVASRHYRILLCIADCGYEQQLIDVACELFAKSQYTRVSGWFNI